MTSASLFVPYVSAQTMPYAIIPATADIPINPIGEIPFFSIFLEQKYIPI